MKTFNRFIWFCFFAIVLFSLAVFLSGCVAKKKTVEKSEYTTEIATVERVNELTEKSVVKESLTTQKKESAKENENEDFQAEIEDPSKDFELKKETKDGTTTWTGKNIKNLSNQSGKSKETSKDSIGQKMSKIDKSKTDLTKKAQTEAKASGKTTNKDLKVERGFPWHWVVLAVLIYALISYKRKSMKPWRWFL